MHQHQNEVVADNGWKSLYAGDGTSAMGSLLFAVDPIQYMVEKLLGIMMLSNYYSHGSSTQAPRETWSKFMGSTEFKRQR